MDSLSISLYSCCFPFLPISDSIFFSTHITWKKRNYTWKLIQENKNNTSVHQKHMANCYFETSKAVSNWLASNISFMCKEYKNNCHFRESLQTIFFLIIDSCMMKYLLHKSTKITPRRSIFFFLMKLLCIKELHILHIKSFEAPRDDCYCRVKGHNV